LIQGRWWRFKWRRWRFKEKRWRWWTCSSYFWIFYF